LLPLEYYLKSGYFYNMEKNIVIKYFKLIRIVFVAGVFSLGLNHFLYAQEDNVKKEQEQKKDENVQKTEEEKKENKLHYELTVTATRVAKESFSTPTPITVIGQKKLSERAVNNVTEFLPSISGLDIVGVGTNQSRPVIRGMRGQRILLMTDSLRRNNMRRQQDFGEITSMVDISQIEQVEILRGPASVLYGSDAMGGVINIITKLPYGKEDGIHADIGYRYSSFDSQNHGFAEVRGSIGDLAFSMGGSMRKARNYQSPAGDFGNISLAKDVIVNDSGVDDKSIHALLAFKPGTDQQLSFRYELYKAENAGFGYVEPALYGSSDPLIRITYPNQSIEMSTLRYNHYDLDLPFADVLSVSAYYQTNERDLDMNIFIPISIPFKQGAGIQVDQQNYTDVSSWGFRLEMNKFVFDSHLITFGSDYFFDNSVNRDTSITRYINFGSPVPKISDRPQVPNAHYYSLGLFLQDDIIVSSDLNLILGIRYQTVNAEAQTTPGLTVLPQKTSADSNIVGSGNLMYSFSDDFKVFLSIGSAFRSPNLIERFFDGLTPEGNGYLSVNEEIKAETSLNIDVGLKIRSENLYFEGVYFNNTIYDGIRVVPTGGKVNNMNEYVYANIDRLLQQGFEFDAEYRFDFGLSLAGNYTKITSEDLANPDFPYTNTFSSKINLFLRYDNAENDFWAEYHVRFQGEQKDVTLTGNPIGDVIPSFNVHNFSAGVTLFPDSDFSQKFGVVVGNLFNTLYSEFSNASFFRPAPKRHLILTWQISL
jgi:outer membrane receptor protein involved in Fe transport